MKRSARLLFHLINKKYIFFHRGVNNQDHFWLNIKYVWNKISTVKNHAIFHLHFLWAKMSISLYQFPLCDLILFV